ncbi:MFS transporter [Sediminibacterium roseum]|uniref:MFS transporter n=1 Tax=Sediminibacterium roseum TaxID=1978412 RepID=A0ABW9ZU71_9BACT|nr:MFS transporter [Sediminibacterium roseum]NCI50688.1 MFS transporter [Sediminibacterium roseum]
MEKNNPFASIGIPEFRNLLVGRFLFITGLRMMSTLLNWWIFHLTSKAYAIGIIGLSEFLPAFIFALYAGHVIDISEKRKILLRGVALYLTTALVFLVLSTSFTAERLTSHWIAVCIYITVFFTGVIRAFTGPTFNVMLASIVPKPILQNATTWNQGTWLSASVTGHAAGGFLIAYAGITNTLVCICLLILSSFFVMYQLKKKPALNVKGEKKTWDSVIEGLQFVFKTKELLGALSLDLFAVLFGGAVAMIPVYTALILKVSPVAYGWLNAASDIGSVCIVILMTLFPLQRKQGMKLLYAVGGFGLCIIIFAVSRNFWLSFAALMISGMLDGISVVIRGTIMQLKTPDHMRGRVSSVNSMFINSSNELGQFESGISAQLLGNVPSVIFGGCMTLLVVVTTWFKAPSLRKMEY